MAAEKGIFLDVLPRFDMAAMGAILGGVENMFKKSGAAMGASFGKEAEANIARLAEAQRKSANVTEDAELRKTRAIHATEIADQQAALATERRALAEARLQEVQTATGASETTIAEAKLRVQTADDAAALAADRRTVAVRRLAELQASEQASEIAIANAKLRVQSAENLVTVATERRTLAESRLQEVLAPLEATENAVTAAKLRVEAATIAETRASYLASDAALAETARARDLATATGLSAAAADKHAAAVGASAVTAGNAGRVFGVAGAALTGGFVLAVGESTKKAADFQQSMVKLTASAGESQGNIKVVSDGILQLAGQVGVSAQDLANSMFLVEKAGYQGGDGLKVLTAAAQLANAEGADLNDTINGLTTSMHDFGYGVDQAAAVASKLNVAAGDSKAPLQEFSEALHNVEPTAAAAKIGLDEVYASMARITQSGAGASQASEWLNNTIGHLANPNGAQQIAMNEIGLDPMKIQQDVKSPENGGIGMQKTIEEISNAINSRLNPAQQVVLDQQYKSTQAVQSLNLEYERLTARGPQFKALADQLKAGTISAKDLQKLRVGGKEDPDLTNFANQLAKLEGVNAQIKKGQGDLLGVVAAYAKVFGTDSAFKVVDLLAGTPEQAKAMDDELKKLQTTTAQADGTVKGFNETQDTLNKRLKDAKAGFGAAAIQLGNDFLPALTLVANALKDVAQFLAQHKIILDGVVTAIGLAAAAWVGMQTKMMATGVWNFLAGRQSAAIVAQNALTAAVERTNLALEASGAAAAKGEVGVAAAEAGEVTAVEAVGAATSSVIALLATMVAFVPVGTKMVEDHEMQDENYRIAKLNGRLNDDKHTRNSGRTGGFVSSNDGLPKSDGNDNLQGKANTSDRRGLIPGSAGNHVPGPGDPGFMDPLAGLNNPVAATDNTIPLPAGDLTMGGGGGGGGGAGGAGKTTPAAPVGNRNDPIFIDPSSITDGLNSSDMGSSGSVGGGMLDIFQKAGSGGFTLKNIATLMGTFVANLALGNPAGKLATGVGLGGDKGGDLTQSITDIENMSPAQRIEEENTIKMRKAISAYKKALRSYAKAVAKYGAGSDQALDAEDSVLSAKDGIGQAEIGMQQKGGSAAQAFADDQANGMATKNPGKYAKDQAAAQAYSGGGGMPTLGGVQMPGDSTTMSRDEMAKLGLAPLFTNPANGGSPQIPSWVQDFVHQNGGAGLTASSTPHGSLHGVPGSSGYAVDVTGPNDQQDALAAALKANPGLSAMMIHQSQITGQDYGVNGGQDVSGRFFTTKGGTYGDEAGMVHWAPAVGAGGPADLSDVPTSLGGGRGAGDAGTGMGFGAPAPKGPLDDVLNHQNPQFAPQGMAGRGIGGIGGAPISGGQGPVGPQVNGQPSGGPGLGQAATSGVKSSQPVGGTGKGAGASGGGLLGGAIGAAETAANMFAPGAGAGVQIAAQEAERAAQFAGQAVGIGAQGLLETFSLHGPDGEGGSGGWLGKVAGGIAGAHPSIPDSAGALKPAKSDASKPPGPAPALQPGDATNGKANGGGSTDNSQNINIANQNINHDDGGANNRDAIRMLQSTPLAPG